MTPSPIVQKLKEYFESLTPEKDQELSDLFDEDPELGANRMIELAAQNGIKATIDDVDEYLDQLPEPETTISLDQFKKLQQSVSPEITREIASLISTDYDACLERIVEVASSKGVSLPLDEVDILLDQLDVEADESAEEDYELDALALTAVAGGRSKRRGRGRRRYASSQYHRQATGRSYRARRRSRSYSQRINSRGSYGRRW